MWGRGFVIKEIKLQREKRQKKKFKELEFKNIIW